MRKGTVARRALLVVVAAAIWILSDQPSLRVLPPLFPGQDKAYHVVEFFALGAVLWANRDMVRGRILLLLAAGALWGGLDEIHQSWVPGRDCSVLDFLADVAGLCIFLCAALLRRRGGPRPPALDAGSPSSI